MESVLGRYRNLTILVGVLFLQILGLAVQVKRSGDAANTRLIRIWAVDTITPFERMLVWTQNSSGNLWHNYFFLRGVRAENRQLKQQIEEMRLEQVRLSEDAEQAHRLQELLAFKEQYIGKTVAAQVIGFGGSDLSRIVYIDKGKNDGIEKDLAVINAKGIVGKVLEVFPRVSQVLLINDQTSGAGAMLEKSRLQGVLKGTPDGAVILERVMADEQVAPGDVILSSGGDRIFPKGLPVGTVTKVSPGREMFLKIEVKPAADLSRLEEVLVVTEKREQEAVADSGTRVRAADILAQRLPSVPDKPVVDAAAGSDKVAAPAAVANGSASVPTGSAKPDTTVSKPTAAALPAVRSTDPTAVTPNNAKAKIVTSGSAGAAGSVSGKPQTTTDLAAKKPAPKAASGDAVVNTGAATPTGSSDTIPAKPAPVRPKAPAPQPPAADDNPH